MKRIGRKLEEIGSLDARSFADVLLDSVVARRRALAIRVEAQLASAECRCSAAQHALRAYRAALHTSQGSPTSLVPIEYRSAAGAPEGIAQCRQHVWMLGAALAAWPDCIKEARAINAATQPD